MVVSPDLICPCMDFPADHAYLTVRTTVPDADDGSELGTLGNILRSRETSARRRRHARQRTRGQRVSHETRLVILCLLIDGEKSVGEIEQRLKLRQAFISQQLARLRADDLVGARRDGKNVYYAIARPEVIEIIDSLYRAFCAR